MVLQNGFSYSLYSIKFKYETYFLKMKTKDLNTLKIFIFLILNRVKNFLKLNAPKDSFPFFFSKGFKTVVKILKTPE